METGEFDYRSEILHSACMLCVIYRELFVYGLNAALCSELSDLREVFEDGDEYPGDVSLLEALDDPNIRLLLQIMYDVERTGDSLLNINNFNDEVLKEALAQGIGDECISELSDEEEFGSYRFWMNDAMGFAHLSVYYLMQQCYRLTHQLIDIPEEADILLAFPTDESLQMMEGHDQNVAMLVDLCFRVSGKANELCERLMNPRDAD